MANNSDINTNYETYKAITEQTAINFALANDLDYQKFIQLNEGKFNIKGTTYYLIRNMIYRTKIKSIEVPKINFTITQSDDDIEEYARIAAIQNINSDNVINSESIKLRELVERQGNLDGIIVKHENQGVINSPSTKVSNIDDFLTQ